MQMAAMRPPVKSVSELPDINLSNIIAMLFDAYQNIRLGAFSVQSTFLQAGEFLQTVFEIIFAADRTNLEV